MADQGLTEVSAIIQKVISPAIQQHLIANAVVVNTVQDRTSEVGPGMNRLDIPNTTQDLTPETKGENSALTAQVLTYTADQLSLDQHKAVFMRIEDIADLQARPAFVQDMIARAGRELAKTMDQYIVSLIEATSAATPDHRIAFANSGTDNTLGKADLLEARRLLKNQDVPVMECTIGMHPDNEAQMLAIDDFVHADKYGSAGGLINGEVGRIYGMRVVVSTNYTADKVMVYHPTHVAFARQQLPRFQQDVDLANVAREYLIDHIYGGQTLDSGVRGVLLGAAS